MANANQPSGLAPVRYINGNAWNGALNMYCILAADTNAYWIGDPVTTIGTANGDGAGVPAVTLCAAGTACRGVICGIGTLSGGPYANPNNLNAMVRPTGAQTQIYYVAVCDDPDVAFEIQEGGVGAVLTATSINRNVNWNLGARTAGTILSGAYLDNATVNTTATLNMKILRAAARSDNTPFAANQKWIVKINNHEFSSGTTSP